MGWYELSHWERRSEEFGALRLEGTDVVMDYRPSLNEQVWVQWKLLAPHHSVLDPLHGGLRYAALDWGRTKLALRDHHDVARFATWGCALVELYRTVKRDVRHAAWLAHPLVKFDLHGTIRVAFRAAPSTGP